MTGEQTGISVGYDDGDRATLDIRGDTVIEGRGVVGNGGPTGGVSLTGFRTIRLTQQAGTAPGEAAIIGDVLMNGREFVEVALNGTVRGNVSASTNGNADVDIGATASIEGSVSVDTTGETDSSVTILGRVDNEGDILGVAVRNENRDSTTSVLIRANGVVRANSNALYMVSDGFTTADFERYVVTNNGTLEAIFPQTGPALLSDRGTDFTTSGTLGGTINVSTFDDVVINLASGVWTLPNQTSLFDTGSDSLSNRGTMVALSGTRFTGLETFANQGGVIRLNDGSAGDIFSVDGDFVASGGELRFDVALGDDTSATDRLFVGGDVALGMGGPTGIRVSNANGAGAETERGILVVDVGGTSDARAFYLANEAPLEVGAFVYDLTHNAEDNGFYLSSTGAVGPTATIYESAPALAFGAFGRMPTLAQRVGERQVGAGRDGFWLRLTGGRGSATPDTSTAGASWDFTNSGLQVGYDRVLDDAGAGQLVLGVTAQAGRASADVVNAAGAGDIDMTSAGVGLTATWTLDSGFYLDAQLSLNRLSADFATGAAGSLASGRDGTLAGFSLEAGHRLALGAKSALVPQAQLTFGRLNGADFTDAQGNMVDLGTHSMTTVRLGLAYQYQDPAAPGTTLYVIGNLLRDLSTETTVLVDGTRLAARNDRTWAEIGEGGTVEIGERTTAYAEGSYRKAGGGDNDAFALTAGLRMVW